MRRYACLYFPHWPIQRLVVARPELRRQHVVLFVEQANRGQLVAAASPRALQAGVRVGMPLAEAKSLMRRADVRSSANSERVAAEGRLAARQTQPPVTLPHDWVADGVALTELARQLQQFSPLVGLDQGPQPHSLWLELTGVEHLFGDQPGCERNLLTAAILYLRDCGYFVQASAADTLGQAWALARFRAENRTVVKINSEANSNSNSNAKAIPSWLHPRDCHPIRQMLGDEPAVGDSSHVRGGVALISGSDWPANVGMQIASRGSIWEQLDALPPAALRLEPLVCETLAQLGIERIGQLRCLPRASLLARFGDQISKRLDQAAGVLPEIWQPLGEEPRFQAEQLFDFPVRDRGTIEVVVERLLGKVCRDLRAIQQGALQWQIVGRTERAKEECVEKVPGQEPGQMPGQERTESDRAGAPSIAWIGSDQTEGARADDLRLTINLFQPTATVRHVMQLVMMQLEQQRQFDWESTPVQELSVRAARCVLLAERQRQLFDEDPRWDGQELGQLLNRMAVRLGSERILRPVLVAGAQPELAFRYHVLVGNDRPLPRSVRRRTDPASQPALSRPLRLLPRPWSLAVSLAEDRSPALLENGRWRAQAARSWGPERIETGWWRGTLVRRDYWRVQTVEGQLLWVYHDLNERRWFLHGTF